MRLAIDHVVVAISDWERSNAFYRDVLGAEVIERGRGYAYRFGDQQLNVHGPGVEPHPVSTDPVRPGNSDLCIVLVGRSLGPSSIYAVRASRSRKDRWSAQALAVRERVCTSGTPTAACSS